MRARVPLAVAVTALALSAGCAGSGEPTAEQPSEEAVVETRATPTTRADSRTPRQRRMASVVRAWSARLNAGDNAGVARLFALPAEIVQGPFLYRFPTREGIASWHAGLPCAGRVVSITFRGRFATAVFRLGNRGATACDAPGTLAAARFEIVDGRIVSWQQVEVSAGLVTSSEPLA